MILIKDSVENVCVERPIIKIILRVEGLFCECRHCGRLGIFRVCNTLETYTLSPVLGSAGQKEGQETMRQCLFMEGE